MLNKIYIASPIAHPNPSLGFQALSGGGGGTAGAGGKAAEGARRDARCERRPVRSFRPGTETTECDLLLHPCAFLTTVNVLCSGFYSAGAETTDSVHSRGRGAQRERHRVAARTATSG